MEAVTAELNKAGSEKKLIQQQLEGLSARGVERPKIPTAGEVAGLASDVEGRMAQDPEAAREMLRRMLEGGSLKMIPQPDGSYRAESHIMVLNLPTKAKRPGGTGPWPS